MTRRTESLPNAYFESLYREAADPWRFASSDYERAKYAATLAALGDARIGRAFEIGCSIGVFTRALAERCDGVLGVDVSQTALDAAAARCADRPQVELKAMRIPEEWPEEMFDLIILSEVLYYLVAADIVRVARLCHDSLVPGGRLVLVHWTGETDYPCTGDEAASLFMASGGADVQVIAKTVHPEYRLDVLRRRETAN